MADPLQPTVIRTEQGARFDGRGAATTVYRVSFMVGEHGPFTIELSPGDFIPERVRQEMERVALTVRAITA